MPHTGIPEKAIKGLSIRNKRDPKKNNNKTRPNQDTPFAKEENSNQIKWPTKAEYQQLMDELKA